MTKLRPVRIISDSRFLFHDIDSPENPGRISEVVSGGNNDLENLLEEYEGRRLNRELELAHSEGYIDLVRERCRSIGAGESGRISEDTVIVRESYAVAKLAVETTIEAAYNTVFNEENTFAVVRPPGHHAGISNGEGFCIFNNVAIASLLLSDKGKRVLIFDFDLHHGNGTEEIIRERDDYKLFFISAYQSGIYPDFEPNAEVFEEENILKIPLKANTDDFVYMEKVLERLKGELKKFDPDVVAVSAGFDSSRMDKETVENNVLGLGGGGFELSDHVYIAIREIVEQKPTFYVLEGGYSPKTIKHYVDLFERGN